MFEDSLFATNRHRNPQQRWAALMSFALQVVFVTVIVVLPLYFTDALPLERIGRIIEMPAVPHSGPPPAPEQPTRVQRPTSISELDAGRRVIFHSIPRGPVRRIVDEVAPPQPYSGPYVPGATGTGPGSAVINDIIGSGMRPPIVPAPPSSKPVSISHIDEGLLIHKVTPLYPHIAMITRQQGTVQLHAIIGRDGTVEHLEAVSGPPLLIQAALDAVAQWRYRPYVLNGQPVAVETQITVNFRLGE